MITSNQVHYVNYLKETYGQDLEAAMLISVMNTDNFGKQFAYQVAHKTLLTGLAPELNPDFYKQYKDAGGDPDYLRYALSCFKKVRAQLV